VNWAYSGGRFSRHPACGHSSAFFGKAAIVLGRALRLAMTNNKSPGITIMNHRFIVANLLGIMALFTIHAPTSHGEQAFALSGGGANPQQIVGFQTTTPGVTTSNQTISGTTGGETLVDIDFYPVDRQLYGMGATTGTLYRIDPNTGAAVVDVTSTIAGPTKIDFNPVADRLRVFAGTQNFRLTPSTFNNAGLTAGAVTADGALTYALGDTNEGEIPNLVGAAYTNPIDGILSTSLYSLDASLNALILHTGPPQFSTLTTVGSLSLLGNPYDLGTSVGFDISRSGAAYITDGNLLFQLALGSGELTALGAVSQSFAISSLAVMVPEPSSVALLGIGMLVLGYLGCKRRQK
jgi:hypothetical protein